MSSLRDTTYLFNKLNITTVPIGVYDAPIDTEFNPMIQMAPQKRNCIFAYYNAWMRGQTLKITSTDYGCLGSGYWLFSKETRTRKDLVDFLTITEGLKCNPVLTEDWLEGAVRYAPKHKTLFIGPLKDSMQKYLKSITFFVTPDQLSALVIAANYAVGNSRSQSVSVPFGSGCFQMVPFVADEIEPHAVIGGTDLSMRTFLPDNILAFTVNPEMFELLCKIGENSFLSKSYFENFVKERNHSKLSN